MLECVLDLARRVGATNVLFFPCPGLFLCEQKIRFWANRGACIETMMPPVIIGAIAAATVPSVFSRSVAIMLP